MERKVGELRNGKPSKAWWGSLWKREDCRAWIQALWAAAEAFGEPFSTVKISKPQELHSNSRVISSSSSCSRYCCCFCLCCWALSSLGLAREKGGGGLFWFCFRLGGSNTEAKQKGPLLYFCVVLSTTPSPTSSLFIVSQNNQKQ